MADVPSNLIPTRLTQLPLAPVADADSLMMIVYQGNNYQIRVGDLLQVAGVPTTRQVIAGTGLTGGGQLSTNVTLSIAPGGVGSVQLAGTGVAPGTYGDATTIPVFTVDATGRVVSAGQVPVAINGYVPTSRQITAGDGLIGGGPLSSDIAIQVDLSAVTPGAGFQAGVVGASTAVARADHQHPAVDLSDDDQVDNILGLDNGGTARSIVADAGAVIWSGADGLYVGPVGQPGQVLVSGGVNEYTWGSALTITDQPANVIYAGPSTGASGPTSFRSMVNDDLPDSGVTSGTYGSANAIPQLTVNDKGVVTFAGSVPFSSGMSYQGNWNAATNTPTLASGTGINSQYYIVSTPGGTALDGITDWKTGDWAIFNGTAWQKIDQSNDVTSVNTKTGDVVLTYVDVGAAAPGANSDITSLSGVSGGISQPDYIQFDTTPETVPTTPGALYWDSADGNQTLSLVMAGSNAVQQVGQETYYRIKASSAITEGQVIMFTGSVGASGSLTGAPATGLGPTQSEYVMGVATENIALNGWGYVTWFGLVRGINTTGGAEAWADGQVLYYNPAVAGGLTKNVPLAPNPKVIVASVVHAASNGSIFVRPTFGSAFGSTDSNVQFGSLTDGDVITYDATLQYWKNIGQSALNVPAAGLALTSVNTNSVLYLDNAGDLTTNTGLTFDGAKLGVGTASPAEKLEVVGGVRARPFNWGTAGAVAKYTLGDQYNFVAAEYGSYTYMSGPNGVKLAVGSTDRLVIDSSGNVILGATGGSESMKVVPVAGAVNRWEALGSTAGGAPVMRAAGTDANIDLELTPKGSGIVKTSAALRATGGIDGGVF